MIAASPVACVSSFKFLTMQIYPSGSLARNCGPFYPRPPCSQTSRSASAGELSRSDLVLWHKADIPTAPANVRYWRADSTDRRNTGVESLCWGFKLQGLTGPFVELTRYFIQIGLRVHRQVGSLRKVLSQQTIG